MPEHAQETLTGDDCMYPEAELRATAAPVRGMVALYRFYDAHEDLLYVGISNDPRRRWKDHAQAKPWYPRVRHQALTWYPCEDDAGAAETRAIREERPEFNIAGAIRPARARFTIRPHRWVSFAAIWGFADLAVICVMVLCRPTPLMREVVVPCVVAVTLVQPVSWLLAFIAVGAPWIRRFGIWIERNSISYSRDGAL